MKLWEFVSLPVKVSELEQEGQNFCKFVFFENLVLNFIYVIIGRRKVDKAI